MLQILTIAEQSTQKFDETVNLALQQGWGLTRRYYTPDNFFVAELEKEIITEDERDCENCKHFANEAKDEPCASCTDNASNWEAWDA